MNEQKNLEILVLATKMMKMSKKRLMRPQNTDVGGDDKLILLVYFILVHEVLYLLSLL